jgi:hypothetical protein
MARKKQPDDREFLEQDSGTQHAAGSTPLFRLTLDAAGVYWGATEVHPDDVKDGDAVLDHVPDNRHGAYRWNAAEKRLEPLPKSQQKEAPSAPDLESAFDALCRELFAGGVVLPAPVVEWREWYAKSVDRRKSID